MITTIRNGSKTPLLFSMSTRTESGIKGAQQMISEKTSKLTIVGSMNAKRHPQKAAVHPEMQTSQSNITKCNEIKPVTNPEISRF